MKTLKTLAAAAALTTVAAVAWAQMNHGAHGGGGMMMDMGQMQTMMDAMMPDQDGYETTQMIRRHQRFADLAVVFLTAKAMPGDREEALAAGANDYITKPVDLDELLDLIARTMTGRDRSVR